MSYFMDRLSPSRVLCFATLVFLSGPIVAGAQDTPMVRLEGAVTDRDTGFPVGGASLQLGGTEVRAITDEMGRFVFSTAPRGEFTLIVQRLGYETHRSLIVIGPGALSRADVILVTEPLGLDPLMVLATRTRMVGDAANADLLPGAAHVLSRDDLEELKLPFDNVHQMLRQIPGVNVQEEDGFGLRPNIGLRGTGVERSSKITLMEDGVLAAPAPYAAPAAYYFPVAGRMEAIEVRKGSSQVRYGPRTIGGALNLVSTAIPRRASWFADLAGGEESTLKARVNAGGASRHFGWLLETYQLDTKGFKRLPGEKSTGFRLSDVVGKVRVNSSRGARVYQELELKIGVYDERSDETYLGLTDADFELSPLARYAASQADVMNADHELYQLRYFLRPIGLFDVTTTAYRNDFSRNWYKLQSVLGSGLSAVFNDPDQLEEELSILKGKDSPVDALKVRANNRTYRSQGIQTTVGKQFSLLGSGHDLEIGLRYHEDYEDRLQWEDGFRMSAGQMIQTSFGAPGSQSNRLSEASAWALYVQDQVRLGRLVLTSGVRYESIDLARRDFDRGDPTRSLGPTRVRETRVEAVIPGVGFSFSLSPRSTLFGGVHRGFAPPSPGADQGTEAERSANYELGARVRRSGAVFESTVFFSDYSNILGEATLATGDTGVGNVFNGGRVDVWGVELSGAYDLAEGMVIPVKIPLRAAYTYTHGKFRSGFESAFEPWGSVSAGDRLPYLPEHQFSASASVKAERWSVGLSANGSGQMRTRAGQGPIGPLEGTDSYVSLNLVGEIDIPWQAATAYLSVQNLTNRVYNVARRPAGLRPGMPRTFLIGVRVRH